MDIHDLARIRLVSQHLAGNRFASASDLVRSMGAVQAQDYPGAKWGVAQRVDGASDADIDALVDAGEIIRTHVMRPTWHFVHRDDLRWLLELTAPRVKASSASRNRQLGLDDATLKRGRRAIVAALANGNNCSRAELARALEDAKIDTRENRLSHILMELELDRVICSGAIYGRQQTYALFDERVREAKSRPRDEALADLVVRYFRTHGPATPHDCAWWSGLLVSEIRRTIDALGAELEELTHDGRHYWTSADAGHSTKRRRHAHLLPNWDEHVVAYRDHTLSLDPTIAWARDPTSDRLAPHVVAIDGLVVGGWRRVARSNGLSLELDLRRELSASERAGLERAAMEYTRFLGAEVELAGELTSRTTQARMK